jgi:Cu(I)/Ag(I) efflux system membrane fusion protein
MRRLSLSLLISAALVAAGIGGYWLGRNGVAPPSISAEAAGDRASAESPVIYYQHPDGKPLYSAGPKSTPDGRPFRAVHANEDVSFDDQPQATAEPSLGRKILYYRNPMGLPDVSKVPKKDPMGMDYIPAYEDDADEGGVIKISPGRVQRIGVKSEPAQRRKIVQPVRAPGTIQLDERRIAVISLRAESFIESVADITTGSEVRKDQPLFRLYSPAIAAAAAQYLTNSGLQASAQRLLNLAVPQQLLAEIERTRQVPMTITWTAPSDGVVLERNVVEGMRAMPGDVLFRIADHSFVWAVVDVPERDLAAVAEGQSVIVRVRSYPTMTFPGKVALVYPHLDSSTRTVRVRIELQNPRLLLRPEMYAEAEIDTGTDDRLLSVPESGVIDSGQRQLVIVDRGDGRFEPRPVTLGRHGAGYVEIRDGVAEGESVVTAANFLIDAESNLKAALSSLAGAGSAQ